MASKNGKYEGESQELDLERELPAAEGEDEQAGQTMETESRDSETVKLRAERDALVDRLARLQAEFENARRRAAREQQDFREYAAADTIKTLLPVLDSFDRALRAAPAGKSEFRDGIELIQKQFEDALLKMGLRPILAKGEPFNPHLHEAIEMVDAADHEDDTVLDELQRGYKLKERLLRPAMVKVARNPKR